MNSGVCFVNSEVLIVAFVVCIAGGSRKLESTNEAEELVVE